MSEYSFGSEVRSILRGSFGDFETEELEGPKGVRFTGDDWVFEFYGVTGYEVGDGSNAKWHLRLESGDDSVSASQKKGYEIPTWLENSIEEVDGDYR